MESGNDYVERARQLAPQIEACADQIEQERRLAPPVLDALHAAGMFRLLLPRSLDGELDASDPERHVAERRPCGVQAEPVAPGRSDSDVLVLDAVGELGAREQVAYTSQPRRQRVEVGHHDLDVAPHEVRLARRQVELRLAHVDPHVLDPDHDVGVAREAQALDVEGRGGPLVGHAHVDVLEHEDIADVLLAPIVALHVVPPRGRESRLS